MNKEERIELLEKATSNIEEAINNITLALDGTSHMEHARAYIIGHLQTWIGEGNPYDYGTTKYIELLEEEGDFDEDGQL